MGNPAGFALNVWPATEKTGSDGLDDKGTVRVPMTMLDDPKETGVPDIVILDPCVRKVPATEKPVGLGAMCDEV